MLVFSGPWGGDDSIGPQVSVAPDVGIGIGEGAAVAAGGPRGGEGSSTGGPSVASAEVAGTGGSSSPARSVPIKGPGPGGAGPGSAGPGQGESGNQPAVSERFAVAHHAPGPTQAPRPQPTPVAVSPQPAGGAAPLPAPGGPAGPQLVANFENGLTGWSTSALGDSVPRIVSGVVRDGAKASLIRLTGNQSRSQLVLGGDGGYEGAIQIHEGEEYAFAFSFYIQTMVYGAPGADNLIMQLRSDASESQVFGLQLWDYPGDAAQSGGRGLWSSGEAVAGDRFLAEASERVWHDAIVNFKASSQGAGFYEVYLDGQLVDARDEVSLIAPGSAYAQIEVGLFRDGDLVKGTSELRIDAARFGETLESVLP